MKRTFEYVLRGETQVMIVDTKKNEVTQYVMECHKFKSNESSFNLGNTSIEDTISRILEMGYVEK